MKYVEKNGYNISEITLGTVQLGLNYGINNTSGQPSEKEAKDILDTATELGITSFDTARQYGNSENILGDYFYNNGTPTLITKIGRNEEVDGNRLFDEYAAECEESMKALKVDRLPFAKLHTERIINKYGDKVLYTVEKLKKEGYIANTGVSFSDRTRLEEYSDASVFDCIQIPLNMFDCKEGMEKALKKIEDSGIVVFVRSVYLQGLFFKDVETLPEKIKCAKEPILKVRKLAEDNGLSVSELAMAFIRDLSGVSSIIVGCEKAQQLRENVSVHQNSKISDSVRKAVMEIAAEVPEIVTKPWEWNK